MTDARPRADPPAATGATLGLRMLAGWALACVALLVALGIWQGLGYWEYSDGVYALSARQLLHGQALYRDFAAAQPPPLFCVGAAVLAIGDGVTTLRIAMAACEAAVSLLVLIAVWRLTHRRDAALVAALVALVTPWQLREHGQLLPETLAAPLLMAAALAASRRATAVLAGVLAAIATTVKLAIAIPALATVLLGRGARRGTAAFVATGAVLAVAFAALFGSPLWTDVVHAQQQAGYAGLHYVAGLWAQAGWNLLALVVCAALAWPARRRLHDPDLARSMLVAAAGSSLLLATLAKHGSYLTVLVVAEPPLVCLAACGVVATLRDRGASRAPAWRRGAIVAAVALLAAQVGSLLVSPADPALFTRPFARSGPARLLSAGEVRASVRAIRACPAGTAYGGPPYLAFAAGRRIAGSQPDQFIIHVAPVLSAFRARSDADPTICRGAPVPRSP